MLFHSLEFLVFLPTVLAAFYILPHRFRWILLLVASYWFYMAWRPEYAILLVISTVVDWAAAILIAASSGRRRKVWLAVSLCMNLGLLMYFKYMMFLLGQTNYAFEWLSIDAHVAVPSIVLPVGISFYTFQTMSYTIDVYRRQLDPERNLGRFALYVSFFPQLVAGPIERSTNLLPQLRQVFRFDYAEAVSGLRFMLIGMFMKVVIADRLAVYVNQVYGNLPAHGGAAALLATYAFSYQIYCDFAGYSYIAIGSAKLFGVTLMKNFDFPYFSQSISEFWRRWHISLSTWFRDYLYIPLGGNRVPVPRWYMNLLVTFVISGIWHGANWTFVAWGFLHGMYLIAEIIVGKLTGYDPNRRSRSRIAAAARTLLTFHLVLVGWVFFRAQSVGEALEVFRKIVFELNFSARQGLTAGLDATAFMTTMALWVGFIAFEWLAHTGRLPSPAALPRVPRWAAYYAVIVAILAFGEFGHHAFIYFQF